jgi:hypothetical protein
MSDTDFELGPVDYLVVVAGVGRVAAAAPGVAVALGYDSAPRWKNPGDH